MELSAPVSKYLSCAYRVFFLIFALLLCVVFTPLTKVHAQTATLPAYAQPNVDANVPQNQHVLVQSVTIEVMSSLICQLVDIDIFNPTQSCLGVNTTTHKLSYQPSSGNGDIQIGGLAGFGTQLIGAVYTPPASGVSYIKYMASNFGAVKHTYAQTDTQTGFDALWPVQKLWLSLRNLAYIFFVLIFIFIGIAIMLRIHIDAHTVMSIQNQLPKIVIALILISFSYAIVGLLIDFMWVSTYVTINVITAGDNNIVTTTCKDAQQSEDTGPTTLKSRAYSNILNFPFSFMNDIFHETHCSFSQDADKASGYPIWAPGGILVNPAATAAKGIVNSGIANLSWQVGTSMGDVVKQLILDVIQPDGFGNCDVGDGILKVVTGGLFGNGSSISACIAEGVGIVVKVLATVLTLLIVLIAILFAMFKLWWKLLQAYIYIVMYTITAPFWIMLGLLPNSSLGFGRWIRTILSNLLAFPAAAGIIIAARVVMELYVSQTPTGGPGATGPDAVQPFVAPLVGNPSLHSFGALIAFGMLMIAPNLLDMIRNALQTPPGNVGQMVVGGFAAGVGPGTYIPRNMWRRQTALGGHGVEAGYIRKALVGTGDQVNPFQRAIRGLGMSRGFDKDWHPAYNGTEQPGGGGGGGGGH